MNHRQRAWDFLIGAGAGILIGAYVFTVGGSPRPETQWADEASLKALGLALAANADKAMAEMPELARNYQSANYEVNRVRLQILIENIRNEWEMPVAERLELSARGKR